MMPCFLGTVEGILLVSHAVDTRHGRQCTKNQKVVIVVSLRLVGGTVVEYNRGDAPEPDANKSNF